MKTKNTSNSKENLDTLARRCRDWELNHAMLRDELESEQQSVAALRKERDALRAEVEDLREIREEGGMSEAKFSPLLRHVRHTQLRRMEMQRDPQLALDVCAERDTLRAEVEHLRQQASRYERLRRLDPRQFAELHQRNLAGERFDDMVDAL